MLTIFLSSSFCEMALFQAYYDKNVWIKEYCHGTIKPPNLSGGGFMLNQYETNVRKIMDYLSGRKLCLSSRKSHQFCYEELGAYLEEKGLAFSRSSSEQWLKDIQASHNRQQCYFWRKYVEQLHIFLETGSISDELFYQIKPMYDKIPAGLKEPLDRYLAHCKDGYSKRSLELAKIYCSGIMMSLSSSGVNDLGDVTFEVLETLVEKNLYCEKETRYVYLSHARLMFHFFADKGLCPHPFAENRIKFVFRREQAQDTITVKNERCVSKRFSSILFHLSE